MDQTLYCPVVSEGQKAVADGSTPNRKGSRWSSYLDSDCLFPRELGATGMNSSVLTASLTGRIQFFYDVRFVAANLLTATTGLRYVRPSPLGPASGPETFSHLRARVHRGVNEGTSPRALPRPLRLPLRYDVPCLVRLLGEMPRWWFGGPRADGGARPAHDPSERLRSHSPREIPIHLGLRLE